MKRLSPKRDQAEVFLRAELSEGPQQYNLLRKMAEVEGIKCHTLDSAAKKIGVDRSQASGGGWQWRLPVIATDRAQPSPPSPQPRYPSLPHNLSFDELCRWIYSTGADSDPFVAALLWHALKMNSEQTGPTDELFHVRVHIRHFFSLLAKDCNDEQAIHEQLKIEEELIEYLNSVFYPEST
ncbi:hypothetical protein OL229_13600 [Neisseriaceae bacterium JH1-16]|nr:hypothetical protein [Neisseriaceae bacterium JH1-16]